MIHEVTCGVRREGWEEGVGRYRLPCVRGLGHPGAHCDALGDEFRTSALRLLPWSADGKPCFVSSAEGGPVTRMAETVEGVQIAMGHQLTDLARSVLEDPGATRREIRYVAGCLTESLVDVLRIAESRGQRLE